jgi:hypothetical protein
MGGDIRRIEHMGPHRSPFNSPMVGHRRRFMEPGKNATVSASQDNDSNESGIVSRQPGSRLDGQARFFNSGLVTLV